MLAVIVALLALAMVMSALIEDLARRAGTRRFGHDEERVPAE